MDHVNQKSNNPQYIKRYQGMKKRPQTESEAQKNMMIYLKNTAGYKMDFFKGMTYAQICLIFQARFDENMRFLFESSEEMKEEDQEIIKSINETPVQKAAKRRKLSEEAQESKDLRKRLEVVEDEDDDDVFIEATPLTSKADDAVAAAVEEHVAEDVPHDAIPSLPSHVIPSHSQEPSSPPQQPQSSPQAPPQGANFPTHIQKALDVCSALTRRVKNLKHDNAAQKLEIIKLQERVKRLERANKVKSSKLRHLRKVGASRRVESSDDMEDGLDLDHSSKVLSMQEDDSEVQKVVEIVTTAKPSIPAAAPTVVAAYTRRRKGVIIRDPEEDLSSKTPVETPKLKDKGKGILIETLKSMKKKDQIELDAKYAKKLHEEINKDHEEFNKDID
nr:hypothetical protein [Tanacetum cinerariifolium]